MCSIRDADRSERLASGAWNVRGQPVRTRLALGVGRGLGTRIAIRAGLRVSKRGRSLIAVRWGGSVAVRRRRGITVFGGGHKLAWRIAKRRGCCDEQHVLEQRSDGRHLVGQHRRREPREHV